MNALSRSERKKLRKMRVEKQHRRNRRVRAQVMRDADISLLNCNIRYLSELTDDEAEA